MSFLRKMENKVFFHDECGFQLMHQEERIKWILRCVKMEETETDIINRNISQQTLKRQEEILDKLLDAEKASREREKEERRESNEWLENLSNKLLDPLEKYQRDKKRQEELLRTIPPSLNPFYKNKVNEFFKEDGK